MEKSETRLEEYIRDNHETGHVTLPCMRVSFDREACRSYSLELASASSFFCLSSPRWYAGLFISHIMRGNMLGAALTVLALASTMP